MLKKNHYLVVPHVDRPDTIGTDDWGKFTHKMCPHYLRECGFQCALFRLVPNTMPCKVRLCNGDVIELDTRP